ncbi:MAG TPA: PASTA domain-containing protein [Gaiellaceae bacterium]
MKGRVAAIVGAACLAATVVAVPSAQAAVTESHITTPKNVSYLVFDGNAANSFAVSGTSEGSTTDHVDLACYDGSSSDTLATNVPVRTGGAFSAPAVPLGSPPHSSCRLRAIPSGTTPGDLAPFTGPALMLGMSMLDKYASGPSAGKPYGYSSYFQQPEGGFAYGAVGDCGVCSGYLTGPGLSPGPTTFSSNAALSYLTSGPEIRSEIQIDGRNAYLPAAAETINPDAKGLPEIEYVYSQNRKTGDVVIHEDEPIVKCAKVAYPPTAASCAKFTPAGITDVVTITQDHSGRIAWASHTFMNTTGTCHFLDVLWDNSQTFGRGDASRLEYKFPGESSFAMHARKDVVNLASGPGTILVRMHGAADGDTTTGRGAIVYDRTAPQAEFRYVGSGHESFTLRQSVTIGGYNQARFRFAYVQGYDSAQVASLAQYAATVFKGSRVPQVVGKSLAAAKRALVAAHLKVGPVTHVHSSTVPSGHVVSERPGATHRVDYGTAVRLVLSKGK